MRLRIKSLRQERGWTVETLAAKVGMSRSYVSEIENGRKAVNDRRIAAFARAFGLSPLELIDDDSLDSDILRHIQQLRRLAPADREAVIRHAMALDPRTSEEPD